MLLLRIQARPLVVDDLGSLALLLPSRVTLGNSPHALVSPGTGDGGIGVLQLLPVPLGLGAHHPTDCLTLLESVRAGYHSFPPQWVWGGRFPPGTLLGADCSAANRG